MSDTQGRTQSRQTVWVLPRSLGHWRSKHLEWTQETLARKASRTPTALAKSIRVSPSAVAMIESGRRQPSREVAEVLAEAMGLEIADFAVDLEQHPELAALVFPARTA